MALSDGASSAKHAETAAHANVEAILRLFDNISLDDFIRKDADTQSAAILTACREMIRERAKAIRSSSARDYAATLLFAVFDGKNMLTGHLGDGAIFAMDANGRLAFSSDPDNYEEQSNRTYFTVSSDAEEHLRLNLHEASDLVGLVMTSDGAYTMFRNRGGGDAANTALELMRYAAEGEMRCHADLADILNQMAEVPMERLDDWSVLIWDRRAAPRNEVVPKISSMLAEETAKYPQEPAAQAAAAQPTESHTCPSAPSLPPSPDRDKRFGFFYTPKHLQKKEKPSRSKTRAKDISLETDGISIKISINHKKDGE